MSMPPLTNAGLATYDLIVEAIKDVMESKNIRSNDPGIPYVMASLLIAVCMVQGIEPIQFIANMVTKIITGIEQENKTKN